MATPLSCGVSKAKRKDKKGVKDDGTQATRVSFVVP